MKSSVFDLQVNGTTMGIHRWLPDEGPAAGIVQIVHGMAEHGGRYEWLAEQLTGRGWVVIADDHRGHGRTASSTGTLGHFADQNGWNQAVEDLRTVALHEMAQHQQAGSKGQLPHVVIGHSMGSLLARDYASRYGSDLSALILTGSPRAAGLVGKAGRALARTYVRVRGPRSEAKQMHKLTFGNFNAAFKPNRTDYDWLSRDTGAVDAYVADPMCGFTSTNALYVDLIGGLERVNNPKLVSTMPRKLPIWIGSGALDPAGGHRTVKALVKLFKSAGLKDVTAVTWADARHEVFNETNRDEVVEAMLRWLDTRVVAPADRS
ncbi:alpha/beta hydrolase [Aestuariimicrobium sp. p3-SID1156]|uniref:alpha/beta fold hydrolase n=1 Tax=Aestuariimicrobium sp. p3-SID1156 TaxID=2916038 RepID=UPI00223AC080|nr:alpha/beta hydrolase [Aestuariimicrobium sp. p3-SID1156]MCT1459600.1 alpha/beta hydrolase [Aestuariimicrobium sp. p3-SID1156]